MLINPAKTKTNFVTLGLRLNVPMKAPTVAGAAIPRNVRKVIFLRIDLACFSNMYAVPKQ
ncbi:hypothetical protein BPIT_29750 [Candidatus Brocadia pituitae]|nr:hypothetical protein BPIT_29750 [Candidatus Brocadia pituitae]